MNRSECPREWEVVEAACAGAWPHGVSEALREHARSCAECSATLLAVTTLQAEGSRAVRSAPVPSSGVVWWRAQRRMEAEARRRAERPVLIAQIAALVATVAAAAALASTLTFSLEPWLRVFRMPVLEPRTWTIVSTVLAGVAMAVILTPLALYLARADD